ncbi:Mandelate racemase/muconate lactonizing protein [Desulfatibacillum aliphaticivorans]|uniref:Mandelate racemase/muconate lactonizing protein n=1 Tax=Desulfatibacillum aliphaticivorans TaxID=218208 RepID=B8FF94_DESAL|nr:mandelate racemase/muconate lactonizing enzyme family protein [Desulfatibacillum aliphaticivorans]ACL04154.1 Mandelate racemase/muconate lactonizing protein [Desulfatibacillum aliphaticivorans]
MSKIARIELYHVALPLPAPFYPSWIPGLPQTENRFDLIKVTTDDGITGYSACTAMGRERAGLGEVLGPYLLGEEATDIDLINQRVREVGYVGQRQGWIEPAFWDILGKKQGKPVYELLGGKACKVDLYASTGEVKGPEERIEEVQARYEEGFRTVKLRVHDFDPDMDIRQVTETAKAMGDKMAIGVDANQGWRVTVVGAAPLWDMQRAKYFADACADAGLAWIEEPLPMDAYDDLAELTAYSKVPISGGELNSSGLPELAMMIKRHCLDIFQPDACFTGGIAQTFKVAQLCKEHGLLYSPHTWTNGIGFAINLQLMAASGFAEKKALEYPYAPPGWVIEARDGILETPFTHQSGSLQTPTLPGLGFNINEKALKKYGRRFFVMDKKRLVWYSIKNRGIKVSLEVDKARKKRMDQS